AGVVGHGVRVAVSAHNADLMVDPAVLELGGRLLHRRQVALRAHHDPDERPLVHVELGELLLDLCLHHGARLAAFGHASTLSTARAAMSLRSCFPSNSISSAAA